MMRLVDAAGAPVALDGRLGRGGEGEVHALARDPETVAKLIFPRGQTVEKFAKLERMVAQPPAGAYDLVEGFPVLTWPRAVLYEVRPNGRRRPIGYAMTRVRENEFVPFYRVVSAARRRELGGAPVTWDRLVLLGTRLCHLVRTLHRFDYAVGDMNDRNLLVSRRFTPLLMDTDSFQVPRPGGGHFPCVVGDQMYWPPEHLALDYASYRGSRKQGDLYALGVLLFQLFMNGWRPYQSRGSQVDALESLVEKTRAGHYPWKSPRPGVLEPPAGAPRYDSLPASLRRLFERCFVDGHRRPEHRPTADEWYEALRRIHETGYRRCDRTAEHVFGRRERRCPWCLDPNDPFGAQRAGRPARRIRPRLRPPAPKPLVVAAPPRPKARPKARTGAARTGPRRSTRRAAAKTAAPAPAKTASSRSSRPRASAPAKPAMPPIPASLRRWLWVAAVMATCATPLLFLPRIPIVQAGKVVLFALTTLWVGLGLWALTRSRTTARRANQAAVGYVTFGAFAAALAGTQLGWVWLDYANGVAAAVLGIAVFVHLERRRRRAFWPRPRGVLHASLGVTTSYVPTAALWIAARL